jgi:hypothetical protein
MKTVRDGQIVWPYCAECGCRLNINEWSDKRKAPVITHFMKAFQNGKDARGHKCSLIYEYWYGR